MAIGNIQWRFQEPVDLHTQINRIADRKAKMWAEMGKNLGGALQGIHDRKLDEELAKMMEDYDNINAENASMGEQMTAETNLILNEIKGLEDQQKQLVAEVEQLKAEKEQLSKLNTMPEAENNGGFGMENYAGRDAGFGGI